MSNPSHTSAPSAKTSDRRNYLQLLRLILKGASLYGLLRFTTNTSFRHAIELFGEFVHLPFAPPSVPGVLIQPEVKAKNHQSRNTPPMACHRSKLQLRPVA
jgi:hypothetical protein